MNYGYAASAIIAQNYRTELHIPSLSAGPKSFCHVPVFFHVMASPTLACRWEKFKINFAQPII